MEDDEQKTNPNLPANYVTIHDLRERWFKRQQQLNEKENVNQHQQDEEENNQHQPQQPKQNNNRQKPELVVVEKVSGEKEIKAEKKLERSEEKKRNSSQKLKKNRWAEKSRRELTNHSQSAVESVPHARSETVDVAVKPRVRSVSEKKRTRRHQKPNQNDKIKVVVEEKIDSVTKEVEAKIENLSISSVNQLNAGRGGRERNGGGGGGLRRYKDDGFRSFGGGRRNGVGPGPGPNQVWVRKGDAAVLIE